jgi:hypothetical protein
MSDALGGVASESGVPGKGDTPLSPSQLVTPPGMPQMTPKPNVSLGAIPPPLDIDALSKESAKSPGVSLPTPTPPYMGPKTDLPASDALPSLESSANQVRRQETEKGWVYHIGDDASDALKDSVDRANDDLASMREKLQEEFSHSPKACAENLKKAEEEHWRKQQQQFDAIGHTPGQGFGQGGLIEGEKEGAEQRPSSDVDQDEDEEIDRKYSPGLEGRINSNFLVGERQKKKWLLGHKPVTKYFDKDGITELLRRKGNKFTFSGKDAAGNDAKEVNSEHVRITIEALKEEGHTKVKVTGSQELRYKAWLEARLAGMKCDGFKPKPEHIARLADLANERGVELPKECAGLEKKNKNLIGKDSIPIGKDSEEKDSIGIDAAPSKDKKRAREEEHLPDERPEKNFSSLDLAYTINCNDELSPPFEIFGNVPPQVKDLVLKANAEVESIKRSNKDDVQQMNAMEQCRINTMTALMEIKATHMLEVRSDDQLMRQGVLEPAKDGMTLAKVIKVTGDGPAYALLMGGAGPKSEPKIIRLSASQAQGMTVGLKLDSTRPIVSNTLPSPTQSRSSGKGRGGIA